MFVRVCKVEASYQQAGSRPVPAKLLNLRVLRTLRAASSFAAARVPALALSHSTPSTIELEVQHDNETVVPGGAYRSTRRSRSGHSQVRPENLANQRVRFLH